METPALAASSVDPNICLKWRTGENSRSGLLVQVFDSIVSFQRPFNGRRNSSPRRVNSADCARVFEPASNVSGCQRCDLRRRKIQQLSQLSSVVLLTCGYALLFMSSSSYIRRPENVFDQRSVGVMGRRSCKAIHRSGCTNPSIGSSGNFVDRVV